MNRKLTARERWFLTVLPAAVVLGVYGFGIYRPAAADLVDAQRRLGEAQRQNVTAVELAVKRQEARSLQDRLDAAKNGDATLFPRENGTVSGSTGRGNRVASPFLIVPDEAQALAKITDVFKGRNILVVASTRVSDSDARNVMPTGFGEAIKSIAAAVKGASHGGVWRIELVGNFGDLRASAVAIDALEVLVVPLGISMESSGDGGPLHRWSLWVWI